MLSGYIVDGDTLPEASAARNGEHLVAVPVQSILKYFLRDAIADSAMSKVTLAQEMGIDEKEVRRILDPHHNTKMCRLEKALAVTGRQPVVDLIDIGLTADR